MALPTQALFDAAIVELNNPVKSMLSAMHAAALVNETALAALTANATAGYDGNLDEAGSTIFAVIDGVIQQPS